MKTISRSVTAIGSFTCCSLAQSHFKSDSTKQPGVLPFVCLHFTAQFKGRRSEWAHASKRSPLQIQSQWPLTGQLLPRCPHPPLFLPVVPHWSKTAAIVERAQFTSPTSSQDQHVDPKQLEHVACSKRWPVCQWPCSSGKPLLERHEHAMEFIEKRCGTHHATSKHHERPARGHSSLRCWGCAHGTGWSWPSPPWTKSHSKRIEICGDSPASCYHNGGEFRTINGLLPPVGWPIATTSFEVALITPQAASFKTGCAGTAPSVKTCWGISLQLTISGIGRKMTHDGSCTLFGNQPVIACLRCWKRGQWIQRSRSSSCWHIGQICSLLTSNIASRWWRRQIATPRVELFLA